MSTMSARNARNERWLTAQEAAALMNTTSAEVCRLLSIGRLSGSKQKQAKRPGKAQWLIDPKSIAAEKRRSAGRALKARGKRTDPQS
jgi:hypothetical protein